ncbi:hypothetical protein PV326_009407, partial [Microctonus aethiopoides]
MDIGVNITKNLSPKEIKFLEFVPPHTRNYDAVLEKIFDNKAGPEAYQFRRDLIEFHDSVMRIGRLRVDEMNEYNCKVCPRCEYVKKSDATIERMTKKITYLASELKMNLQHMNREVQELSEEKIANNGFQDIIVSAAGANDDDDESYDITGIRMPNQSIYRESAGNVLIDDKAENIHGVTRMVFKSPFNWDELPKHYKSMNLWVM